MTPEEALGVIRGLARAGRVMYVRHAIDRMDQRSIRQNDVENALRKATDAVWQPQRETWKTFGTDMSGEELVVAVAVDDGLLVVTVF